LADRIGFMDIPLMIESVLATSVIEEVASIEQLTKVDTEARRAANLWLKSYV
jgi:1-deoxy-D-xylulose-5-phosphate reductoisomerase